VATLSPFLWFNDDAEEALAFYASVFENSEIVSVTSVNDSSLPGGGFVIGTIRIENLAITILNGGPMFALNEAFSLFVSCDTQDEVDYFWKALCDGGEASQCGWLKDRFGVSWQIIPVLLQELMGDPDPERAGRVRAAMMTMTKIDSDQLRVAYEG
jgi:predicted 3-demethylubiquinone-9 3-methyltransferase (glyoxalase superfamily)